MKKWTTLDTALMPDGQEISLQEHDGDYSVRLGVVELMGTRKHASEDMLAAAACEGLRGVRGARVLIGGLGLGFTLRTALAALGPDASVVVAEISPAVLKWNSNRELPLASDVLADPRTSVVIRDVAEVIRESPSGFDAIMLDVDNGPAELSSDGNYRLYDQHGLQTARAALRPGGCVAFWSATASPAFEKLMARSGFAVEVRRCRANGKNGGWHSIFIGRLKAKSAARQLHPAQQPEARGDAQPKRDRSPARALHKVRRREQHEAEGDGKVPPAPLS
jgi:hypothetical protein